MILPWLDVVELPVAGMEQSFGAIAFVVEHDYDRRRFLSHQIREFHAGHLKSAVADDCDDAGLGPGHVDAERRRYGETHRGIVGWAEEFRLAVGRELGRSEHCVADFGDYHGAIVQLLVE